MPYKLVPPKPGRSPFFRIRGTYLGVELDRSTKTADEALARQLLNKRKREVERGQLADPVAEPPAQGPTFLSAAVAYMKAGGDRRFLGKFNEQTGEWTGLIAHFGDTPLANIDQAAIDAAATLLYPNGTAQTRNRQVHTPVSAILKAAGLEGKVKRPKGWRGSQRVDWLQPEQAFRLMKAAADVDAKAGGEFGAFVTLLLYTGARLSEGLGLECSRVQLREAFAYVPTTKNGQPRGVHLPPIVVAALGGHPRGLARQGRVFRFRKSGRLYTLWARAIKLAGDDLAFASFHTLRHTWATWMRRYGRLDTRGLVGTGAWSDPVSAARYEHVVVSEEARKADLLPTPKNGRRTRA